MIDQLQFMNRELWWVVLSVAILLVLLFVWKEWQGKFNSRFFVNSVVGTLGIMALTLLYLRPAQDTVVSGKAILLTDNYSMSQLDSIKNKEKSIQTIRYRPGLDFSGSLDSINEILVLGDGLRNFDLWQLEAVSATYLKGTAPKGIVKLKYDNTLRLGTDLVVNGLSNESNSGNRLVLETPSGEGLDSIVLKGEKEQMFTLKTDVKASGKFVFRLSEKDSIGTILSSNPLPVEVLEKEVLRIFISNRFPSFESKYLKNFLAEEGHSLVVRSQITKGRYKFEYFNTEKSPVYGFRENELKDFDLVILDADTYLGLSKSNKEVLANLVREKGLGIFVQPSETLFRATSSLVNFDIKRHIAQNNLQIETSSVETYPYRFQKTDTRGIAVQNHSYVQVLGKGRVGTTVLNNTYYLVLDGKMNAYRAIWTAILKATAKTKATSGAIVPLGPFSFLHQPKLFELRTDISKPTVSVNGEYSIPLNKNLLIEDKWHGTTYPVNQGWHVLRMKSDTTVVAYYFVTDTIHWKSLTVVNTIKENSRFFASVRKIGVEKMLAEEINRWWFVTIFLSCMGYLWLIPKITNLSSGK